MKTARPGSLHSTPLRATSSMRGLYKMQWLGLVPWRPSGSSDHVKRLDCAPSCQIIMARSIFRYFVTLTHVVLFAQACDFLSGRRMLLTATSKEYRSCSSHATLLLTLLVGQNQLWVLKPSASPPRRREGELRGCGSPLRKAW
jgi:hypothetical protein